MIEEISQEVLPQPGTGCGFSSVLAGSWFLIFSFFLTLLCSGIRETFYLRKHVDGRKF